MKIPLKYTVRSLWTRRLTTVLSLTGIALVSFVFAAVLMMAHGLQKTLVATGSDDNVIVLRKAATAEITSILSKEQAAVISALPEVTKLPDGQPLESDEIVVIINKPFIGEGGYGNLSLRGVGTHVWQLRPQVHIVEGRSFQTGSREVIVGSAVVRRFVGTQIGESIKFGGDEWKIVGVFDAQGSGFDSEVWGDVDQLGQAFHRPVYSSVTFRLTRRDAFADFQKEFDKDLRLQTLEAKREKQFYEEQSESMATFIRILGIAVTVIFSIGATIGAMITMYAAVANRTVEIGTMRALGFRRRSVMAAFLIESILIAAIGGVAGLVIASFLQFISVSMLNFGTFSELSFRFALSPAAGAGTLAFCILMGIVGGFLPAARAARLNILESLRAS